MKSVKLSLATIVAAGALASVASATPLEQAIKDVDVSGFAWMRYDTRRVRTTENGTTNTDADSSSSFWKFKTQINLKFALDDNFYALLGVRYENRDHSYGGTYGGIQNYGKRNAQGVDGAHDDTIDVNQYALGYHIGNTDILVGRQILGSFLTADMAGTGIKVVNKDISGLTLTGAWFDALEDDVDIGSTSWGKLVNFDGNDFGSGKYAFQNNLATIQINGSYSPVDFALWYADLAAVAGLYGVNVAGFFDINDKFGLGLHGQFAGSNVHGNLKNGVDDAINAGYKKFATNKTNYGLSEAASTVYWALEANMKLFGLDANAGYLQYGKKDAYSLITLEDNGKIIKPGEDLIDTTAFAGKHQYWFVTAKYTFLEKYWVGADFVHGKTKMDTGDIKQWESVARLGYNYSKKLSFWGWWSHVNEKDEARQNADTIETKSDHFRFQTTYKF